MVTPVEILMSVKLVNIGIVITIYIWILVVEPVEILMSVKLVNTGIVLVSIPGYIMNPDGRTCRDIDEYRAGQHRYSYKYLYLDTS